MQLHINEFDSIGGQITAAYSTMEGVPAEWQAVAASGNAVLLTTPNGVAVVSAPRHSGRVAEAIGADAGLLPEAWLGWAFGRQSEADVWAARAAGAARTLIGAGHPYNGSLDDYLRVALDPIPQRMWHTLLAPLV